MIRNCVDFIIGTASFVELHRIAVTRESESNEHTADYVVIAVGTEAARPPEIAFDGASIIDSDYTIPEIPWLDAVKKI